MWFSFWRSRDRFSLDELRYLTDQLMKVQIVNEVNKDFVIEALRSIAELITYGDQHDATFFEFFMEKQVMGEFVRVLKICKTVIVSLQLLQTVSIMIENLKSEHSIYYIFSNEHINYLITYTFDFRNEELLSYYISFLRAISGKLNKNTISLLVKTQNDEVVAFPLYVEAIRFAFHEESMVRTAVRALTLNVYHVGDECVNKYVASAPHADYFLNLVKFFREQCISLNRLVLNTAKNNGAESNPKILSAVDEIEDNLYYFSDVISAGIPDVGRLITDNLLKLLIFPLLLPSLRMEAVHETKVDAVTSLYLLCCILRIVKIKDLANTVAAALFCHIEAFTPNSEAKLNGCTSVNGFAHGSEEPSNDNLDSEWDSGSLRFKTPNLSSPLQIQIEDVLLHDCKGSHLALRDVLLSYVTTGDDVHVVGSLSVLSTLLQTKELDESMLDALGILPQRKKHKKLLLQALVGEGSGEEQLFSTESSITKDGSGDDLSSYIQKLKDRYGVLCSCPEVGESPRLHRYQVLDALVNLFCTNKGKALSTSIINSWSQRAAEDHDESAFVSLLNAYRDACHFGTESTDSGSCYIIQNSETFCNLITFVLREANNIFCGLLKISSSTCKKETILEMKNTSKWKKLKPLLKSYLRSTLFLLNQVTDSELLALSLTRLRASIIFFAAFPSLLQRLIKISVHLWATGGGDLSSCSFLVIRDVAVVFSSSCFDTCFTKTYKAFIARCKVVEIIDIQHIEFLKKSFVELCSLDVQKSCSKALLSVQQLAKILQQGLRTKRKEAIKSICTWQYANCIDIWVLFISANVHDYSLQALFYTTIQLVNGVTYLFPGPRYFPYRLKCIQWLNRLSCSSGIFIPVASFVLDVLEYNTGRDGGKRQKAINFSSSLKLPKNWLKSLKFQEECVFSVIEMLSLHFAQWSYHISFPDLATIPLIRLRKFYEISTVESMRRTVKRLIDQVEQNVEFVQKKRDEVAFSPKDQQNVESFLQLEKGSLNSPFTQYYKSVMEKAASRNLHMNQKISCSFLQQKSLKKGQVPNDTTDPVKGDSEKRFLPVDGETLEGRKE